jgi:subtilase family serine protease
VSATAWERRKAMSDQLRAVWDARRTTSAEWEREFVIAKTALLARMLADVDIVASLSWDEFQRLQGVS